jgi:hypothetical protein
MCISMYKKFGILYRYISVISRTCRQFHEERISVIYIQNDAMYFINISDIASRSEDWCICHIYLGSIHHSV